MRERLENTFSVSHNFHDVNWEYKKDVPLGYHLHSANQNSYVAPSVREAMVAYKQYLERLIKRLDYTIGSNVPEVLQGMIGQPEEWYRYEEGPNGEKNHGRCSVMVDLPLHDGTPIADLIHPSYMIVIGTPSAKESHESN